MCRRPDENFEGVYRWLLERNMKMYAVAFALDGMGDIYLDARLPLAAATPEEIDRLLGSVLEYSDGSFNTILELGFASSIRKEWEWRVSRGESTRNLEAFIGPLGLDRPSEASGGVRSRWPAACARRRRRPGRALHRRRPAAGGASPRNTTPEHDRDRRDEVGGHAEAAGVHVLQREGVRREGDRGREDAEVDQPPHRRGRRGRDLVDQLSGERQAHDRADRAGQPGDLDRGLSRPTSGFCRIRLIE